MAAAICGQIDVGLLPNEVCRAMVRLEMALRGHTDYDQLQVAFDLRNTEVKPLVHFIVAVPEEDSQ